MKGTPNLTVRFSRLSSRDRRRQRRFIAASKRTVRLAMARYVGVPLEHGDMTKVRADFNAALAEVARRYGHLEFHPVITVEGEAYVVQG